MPTDQPARSLTAVSIAGHVGSGKTATARIVADALGWRHLSTGDMFRQIAQRKGMSVLELNLHAETDFAIDDEIDGRLREVARTDELLVIDSRMAWHFVPESFKVYLVVDPLVGAQRVLRASRVDEQYESVEEAARANVARMEAEADRYHRLYGVRRDDWRNYDLVVDTTSASKEHVADVIVDEVGLAMHAPARTATCWLPTDRLHRGLEAIDDGPLQVAVRGGVGMVTSGWTHVERARLADEPLIRAHMVGFESASPL